MLTYSIDTALGLIVVTAAGAVAAADMHALREQVSKDPAYDPALPVVFDLTGASALNFTAQELRQLAAARITHPTARRAYVVSNDLGFGLARMFQSFSEAGGHSENVQVFRDVAEARAWVLAARG
jgi:hypothetical protein